MHFRERDYLMQQFEELAVVLAALLGFKTQGKINEGMDYVQSLFDEKMSLNIEDLKNIPDETLVEFLTQRPKHHPVDLHFAAELLFQRADFLELTGQNEYALQTYRQALAIFSHLQNQETTFSLDRWHKINHIEKILR